MTFRSDRRRSVWPLFLLPLSLLAGRMADAQGVSVPGEGGGSVPPAYAAPEPAGVTTNPGWIEEALSSGEAGEGGLFGLVGESVLGNRKDLWRPLSFGTFFSEGWSEPWRTSPRSSTGAPRQGWINAYDGVFYRLVFFDVRYINNFQKNGNQYLGTLIPFIPISRRFQLRFDVPLIVSNKGGPNNRYQSNFGDFLVSPRFLLSETEDLSQVFECLITTPTGETVNGNGQATLTPQYEFWYGGLPGGGVIRGGAGVTVPTNSAGIPTYAGGIQTLAPGARTTFNYNLSVGKYWTPHDAPLGDFVTFLAINGYSTLDDRGPSYTYLSCTPAFRVHVGDNYYLLAGVEVPVTGPKVASFDWAPILWFSKVW